MHGRVGVVERTELGILEGTLDVRRKLSGVGSGVGTGVGPGVGP